MTARSAPAGEERSTLLPEWRTALRPGEVHVWHGTLETSPDPVSPAEAARARRMRAKRRRREFLVCRGALRRILAATLGIDALAVPIVEGAHGKPRLEPSGLPRVGFNLSHSGGRFVVAIALGMEPGVDVERIRSRRSVEGISRRFFSPAEQAEVAAAPDPLGAFYRVWTRKEAVIKADGRGVGIGARPLRRQRRRAALPAGCTLARRGTGRSAAVVAPLARSRPRLRGRACAPEPRRRGDRAGAAATALATMIAGRKSAMSAG